MKTVLIIPFSVYPNEGKPQLVSKVRVYENGRFNSTRIWIQPYGADHQDMVTRAYDEFEPDMVTLQEPMFVWWQAENALSDLK